MIRPGIEPPRMQRTHAMTDRRKVEQIGEYGQSDRLSCYALDNVTDQSQALRGRALISIHPGKRLNSVIYVAAKLVNKKLFRPSTAGSDDHVETATIGGSNVIFIAGLSRRLFEANGSQLPLYVD